MWRDYWNCWLNLLIQRLVFQQLDLIPWFLKLHCQTTWGAWFCKISRFSAASGYHGFELKYFIKPQYCNTTVFPTLRYQTGPKCIIFSHLTYWPAHFTSSIIFRLTWLFELFDIGVFYSLLISRWTRSYALRSFKTILKKSYINLVLVWSIYT